MLDEINQPLQIKDLSQDPPQANEVLVKVGAAGICASDHHIINGTATWPLPIVLGHEGAGTIIKVGKNVTRVKPNDRCILSFISNCGYCRPCLTGNPQLCDTHSLAPTKLFDGKVRLNDGNTGIDQMHKLGVFSEFTVVPEQACYPIPDTIPMHVGALIGCCVTTGTGGIINNPASRPGMTVAVFGCGGVGLSVIQGARLMNASRIIAVDIHNHKLEFTYKFGATDIINAREADPVEKIKDLTSGGVDMAIDSFGNATTSSNAVKSLRKAGTAIMIGLGAVGETAPVDMVDMVRGQKTLAGSYYGSASPHETFRKLIDLHLRGQLDVESLITRTYNLDNINVGFDAITRGEDGRGVIIFGK